MYYVFEQSLYIQPNLGQYRQANGWDQCYPGEQPCGEYASSPANLSMHSTGMWALQWPSQGMILSLLSVQAQLPSKNQQVCTNLIKHDSIYDLLCSHLSIIHDFSYVPVIARRRLSHCSVPNYLKPSLIYSLTSTTNQREWQLSAVVYPAPGSSSFKFSDAPSANSLRELQEFV